MLPIRFPIALGYLCGASAINRIGAIGTILCIWGRLPPGMGKAHALGVSMPLVMGPVEMVSGAPTRFPAPYCGLLD